MNYTKPSVNCLGIASEAIQGRGHKNLPVKIDSMDSNAAFSTGLAYDLDE